VEWSDEFWRASSGCLPGNSFFIHSRCEVTVVSNEDMHAQPVVVDYMGKIQHEISAKFLLQIGMVAPQDFLAKQCITLRPVVIAFAEFVRDRYLYNKLNVGNC
jgi:hypothetical protein